MNETTSPEALLKAWRKKPLFDPSSLPTQFQLGYADITRLIPHRPPLLYVEQLSALDHIGGLIAGSRTIDPADPILKGHFPNYPVYPGNFTVESIGQLGLCMYYFYTKQRPDLGEDTSPMQLRATKIAGALFQEPILPGDEVLLLAKILHFDGYFGSMIGQAIVRNKVAVVCIGEVMIMD
jgi:3-hydroxyacyl-[acyl-carrier-protein] dehydratase